MHVVFFQLVVGGIPMQKWGIFFPIGAGSRRWFHVRAMRELFFGREPRFCHGANLRKFLCCMKPKEKPILAHSSCAWVFFPVGKRGRKADDRTSRTRRSLFPKGSREEADDRKAHRCVCSFVNKSWRKPMIAGSDRDGGLIQWVASKGNRQ